MGAQNRILTYITFDDGSTSQVIVPQVESSTCRNSGRFRHVTSSSPE